MSSDDSIINLPFRRKADQGDKAAKRKFGNIKTSIFGYISPSMIALIIFVGAVVVMNFEAVKHNFTSGHVALNGLILAVFFCGVLQACYHNFKIYLASKFLIQVDEYMDRGSITADEYEDLLHKLEHDASLINIKTTFKLMENLRDYGNMMIKDRDAIMVKSKLGSRIRTDRNNVSFLTGILVMFGLIGTFWGLLETISAVAAALNDIAQSSSGDTGAADMDMGAILKAIGEPLKGMGLAFSASLFGLSGSLLLGFFSHLSSGAQDKAIEDISRWIDDRIPSPDANMAEKGKDLKPAGLKENSDLEAWLATYAFLARRTDQNLANLFSNLSVLISQFDGLSGAIKNLDNVQRKTNDLLEVGAQERGIMLGQYDKIINHLSPLPGTMERLEKTMNFTQDLMTKSLGHSEAVSRDIAKSMESTTVAASQIAVSSARAADHGAEQLQSINAVVRELERQAVVTEGSQRNAERMGAILQQIQISFEKMSNAITGIDGTYRAQNSGIMAKMESILRDIRDPLQTMRGKIDTLEVSERVYIKPEEKKKFFKFGKRKD